MRVLNAELAAVLAKGDHHLKAALCQSCIFQETRICRVLFRLFASVFFCPRGQSPRAR